VSFACGDGETLLAETNDSLVSAGPTTFTRPWRTFDLERLAVAGFHRTSSSVPTTAHGVVPCDRPVGETLVHDVGVQVARLEFRIRAVIVRSEANHRASGCAWGRARNGRSTVPFETKIFICRFERSPDRSSDG